MPRKVTSRNTRIGIKRKRKKSNPLWIQQALKKHKKGALHRQLGIPVDEKIPIMLLRRAAKEPGLLGRRARLALNLRSIRTRKKK